MKKTYLKPEMQVVNLNRLQPLMITSLPQGNGTVSTDDVLAPDFPSELTFEDPILMTVFQQS